MPDSLDAAEWFLKRVLVIGVVTLVAALAIGLAAQRWFARAPATIPQPAPASSTISLRIDFPGDYRLTYPALPFSPGMTVLEAMKIAGARAPADRPLRFDFKGSGDTTFLTRIEDTPNQGGGTASRNWQFWVNNRIGTTGIGTTILQLGDRVTWVFEPYRDNPAAPVP